MDLVKMRSLTPEQLAEIVGGEEVPIPTEENARKDAPVVDVNFGKTEIGEDESSFAEAEKETDHGDEEVS